jgi:hypothetical protein
MNRTEIQELSIGTLDMSRPFDKPFTAQEAGHIKRLLSDSSAKKNVSLRHFSREGFDGETFHYAGIRRNDNSVPDDPRIKRIYTGGLVSLGFVDHPPKSVEFIKAVDQAGIEIDHFLKHLIK